jgi:hypothetical protein
MLHSKSNGDPPKETKSNAETLADRNLTARPASDLETVVATKPNDLPISPRPLYV